MTQARRGDAVDARLIFRAGGRRYALPVSKVREVARLPRLTPVPLAPPCLLGLGNVGGEVLAILSPQALGGQAGEDGARQLLVLGGIERVGLAVDQVERRDEAGQDVADLPLDTLMASAFPLRDSARRAASTTAAAAAAGRTDDRVALLRFAIGDQSFALPLEEVAEVLPVPDALARLPGGDAVVLGTMAWRDTTLGILSLAVLLGLETAEAGAGKGQPRIVVAMLGGHAVGLLVDQVEGLLRIAAGRIDAVPPALLRTEGEARIRAICRPEAGGRLVSVLTASQLLDEARTRRLLAGATREGGGDAGSDTASARQDNRITLLPVRIGPHHVAFPLSAIERVTQIPPRCTRVPGTPEWLAGVASVGGEPLPIVDQVLRLTGKAADGARQRLLVLRAGGNRVGFLVDEARATLHADRATLSPAPLPEDLAAGIFGEVLQLPGDEQAMLLVEPAALMSAAEQALLAEVRAPSATNA